MNNNNYDFLKMELLFHYLIIELKEMDCQKLICQNKILFFLVLYQFLLEDNFYF